MKDEILGVRERILHQGMSLGLDDYIAILEFYIAARTILGTTNYDPVEILGPIFDLMIDDDLANPGELGEDFIRWSGTMSKPLMKSRVRDYLAANGTDPGSGFEIWFVLTERGETEVLQDGGRATGQGS